ncbi:mRNA interferase MazF [Tangfeifania diversioriginum]|uniref:mRNA interferase MazF n=1 Tax=Tangfeifania diversioriginum TaxID=1168035 RepID=A0A1M6BWB2_9BACT|nr:type II toxin-antitoxin system PemK/MazF family toxin [Tangfeifania diversioriginum]SHI53076.1 mRNA interferase MazF [Tangfeifania diversioriginum]
MNIGDIVLIPFPFSELSQVKVRPAVVITETKDKYKDLVVSAISSVVPTNISDREFIIAKSEKNNLRVKSVVKTDRIVTVKREKVITVMGKLTGNELNKFRSILVAMIR